MKSRQLNFQPCTQKLPPCFYMISNKMHTQSIQYVGSNRQTRISYRFDKHMKTIYTAYPNNLNQQLNRDVSHYKDESAHIHFWNNTDNAASKVYIQSNNCSSFLILWDGQNWATCIVLVALQLHFALVSTFNYQSRYAPPPTTYVAKCHTISNKTLVKAELTHPSEEVLGTW
jgi:hypothetical protein